MSLPITLVWLRRDLRLFDHTALQTAIRLGRPLAAVFVFDRDILDALPADDRRLSFIHESLSEMHAALRAKNVPLWVLHGRAAEAVPALAAQLNAAAGSCACKAASAAQSSAGCQPA